MKFDFICLTYEATKAIIQSRSLQSLDFDDAYFILNIANATLSEEIPGDLHVNIVKKNKGLYIIHDEDNYKTERNTVTLDYSSLSFDAIDDNMKITCIQKTLRFCVKYWDNMSYSKSEIIPLDSTKGIIFPFNTKNGSSYKVAIELSPFKNNTNKERKYKGKHLLVYKFSKNSGAKNKEECDISNLKKSLQNIFSTDIFKNNLKKTSSNNSAHGAVTLNNDELMNTTALLGRKNPYEVLSDKQLSFVNSDWRFPARLHGPAGTGKTICLVLKTLRAVLESENKIKVLFIVPSTSIRHTVEYFINVTARSSEQFKDVQVSQIKVRTIQQVCMELLGHDISETELLDEDSYEAKQTQLLHISVIVEEIQKNIKIHKQLLSQEIYDLFSNEDSLTLAELLVHEFGVAIKGRCGQNKEKYVRNNIDYYCIPTKNENDRYFIFKIFESYQLKLDNLSQFDPDDIALSAIGKLESPLWKRRRTSEGFDFIAIDELHLLNFNELSIIHFLSKKAESAPISFALDATQAIGDIAWKNESVLEYMNIDKHASEEKNTDLTAVFRCSSTITKLASTVTSSGTSLFTNFFDPLAHATDMQTELNDYTPEYILYDESSLSINQKAFTLANNAHNQLGCMKHRIIIIYFDRLLFEEAKAEFEQTNKSVTCLLDRGDIEVIEKAKNKNDYIIAMADYVGGLEFDAVILVGIDKARFPREDSSISDTSKTFHNYTAHNRMYVAITRATKIVTVLGDLRRGPSSLLSSAIEQNAIILKEEM
ncbi:UvrD-helicase domain-containing protein [Shewanella sp. C32]|uniref:UvrD-helicase domain-containing protein n=1 Tax=Shewanella electrica TaxID=515560 RepID=A0ABT2FJC8_9GAMM|nr:UvrD-helicase domain-containing protein [Shewanella electrica]MCH1924534.1 UvrD-helicase domain-containing protein [Shewanella electrica]MCS4556435.1 UvrD-helicase domain-containing protein [Shewanella electrica]